MRTLLAFTILFSASPSFSQVFFDGFEAGDLSAWMILRGEADLVVDPVVEGDQACRIYGDSVTFEAAMIHRTFQNSYGTYAYRTRGDSEDSDADFYFQYIDDNNYYQLSHKPEDTDNSEFLLFKLVNGDYTELYQGPPVAARGEWLDILIERTCTGEIRVYADGQLIIDILDIEIMDPGSIGFRAWSRFSYFDSIAFEPSPIIQTAPVVVRTCSGSGFAFGGAIYNNSGLFMDTLLSTQGCDSAVTLDLTFVDVIEVDTQVNICRGTIITIGEFTFDTPGTFSDTLMTDFGCDSIVNYNILFSQSVECGFDNVSANIFSPNGDMINDTWSPSLHQTPIDYEIKIFDRWGTLVFQSTDVSATWNGQFKGRALNTGVYIYNIKADNVQYQGDITLIR